MDTEEILKKLSELKPVSLCSLTPFLYERLHPILGGVSRRTPKCQA